MTDDEIEIVVRKLASGNQITREDMIGAAASIKAMCDTLNKAWDNAKEQIKAMIESEAMPGLSLRSGGKIRMLSHGPTICQEAKEALGESWNATEFMERCGSFSEKSVREYLLEKGVTKDMPEVFKKTYSEQDKAKSVVFKKEKK